MTELFFNRAAENLKAAELLLDNELFNASANRAYFSVFHLALALLFKRGLNPAIDHNKVISQFINEFINKRKVFPSQFKEDLKGIKEGRRLADYSSGISKTGLIRIIKYVKNYHTIVNKEYLK